MSFFKIIPLFGMLMLMAFAPSSFAGSKVVKVLTYNIAGLPGKINKARFKRIREIFKQRMEQGNLPDILLFQEAFTKRSQKSFRKLDLKNIYKGPRSNIFRAKYFSSGTYIVTDHEIVEKNKKSFRGKCTSWDCFANKGIAHARVQIEGIPFPIDIVTSHMQSNSKADPKKASLMRGKQIEVFKEFFAKKIDESIPMILAGDINMRPKNKFKPNYSKLLEAVSSSESAAVNSGDYCLRNKETCSLDSKTTEEEVYLKTVDHHLFRATSKVKVEPIFVSRNFKEIYEEDPLSDHDGYEVHYKISW